jgi:hydroxymethylpyrimidine/phosphomethylpyrimidine kinase
MKVALTIAGSDSGGGAGIQADLKTFSAYGVFGTSALTAITAQNTLGVQAVQPVEARVLTLQIQAVLADFPVAAIKTGMLLDAERIAAVAAALPAGIPLVIDPVMIATSGDSLLDPAALAALRALLPRATLITPNLPEAAALLGQPVQNLEAAAAQLAKLFRCAVLLKGGHDPQSLHTGEVVDVLQTPTECLRLRYPYLDMGRPAHGTGCTLSAAIAAGLALGHGLSLAVLQARAYLQQALEKAPRQLGKGAQPLSHSV